MQLKQREIMSTRKLAEKNSLITLCAKSYQVMMTVKYGDYHWHTTPASSACPQLCDPHLQYQNIK